MGVVEILKEPTLSLEVFPPKKPENLERYAGIVAKMDSLNPDFMSVTYGASGGTKSTTLELSTAVNQYVPVVSHINCDGLTHESLENYLKILEIKGIKNVLALRGDVFDSPDFTGSLDLIKAIKSKSKLCVGGACYPERHPDSLGMLGDLEFLRQKVEAGCSFLVTQMCFEPRKIVGYLETLYKAGINVPIVIGVMPLVKKSSLDRLWPMNVSVPKCFYNSQSFSDDYFRSKGIEYCIELVEELKLRGVSHIHLYTMNDFEVTKEIVESINR